MEEHQGGCRELLEELCDYVDGELEEKLCAELETHLAGCPDCRVMVDTLRKTIVLYRLQKQTELGPEVKERLYRLLKLE